MLTHFPKYFTDKAIGLYIGALIVVSLLFFSYSMTWYWYLFGLVEVVGFFYFSNSITNQWSILSEKVFIKRLFSTACVTRMIWVVFSYFFYQFMTGQPFEFSAADAQMYHEVATNFASQGFEHYESVMSGLGLSDRGYPTYLGIIYMLTGKSIFLARIVKALLSAFTCVLIYRLAKRTFGENVGRMAAIFCMLMPNLIYYCGLHLKETEMVFLTVAFVERADNAMRSSKITLSNLILPILLAVSLFFFRTVLGAAALFSFFTALIFLPGKVIKGWKRIILLVWVLMAVAYFLGGRISTEVEQVWEARADNQSASMEWRAQRKGGNQFAKYMTGAVFAPMILVIPFPTMVDVETQKNQQFIHGGNYVKNIMAFFAMFALFRVLIKKKWRDFSLIGSFTFGYLLVIASSSFAHSERFHLPALPFVLTMAAYGVSLSANKTKNYYLFYLVFIFMVIIAWNWFKLAGRELI